MPIQTHTWRGNWRDCYCVYCSKPYVEGMDGKPCHKFHPDYDDGSGEKSNISKFIQENLVEFLSKNQSKLSKDQLKAMSDKELTTLFCDMLEI